MSFDGWERFLACREGGEATGVVLGRGGREGKERRGCGECVGKGSEAKGKCREKGEWW